MRRAPCYLHVRGMALTGAAQPNRPSVKWTGTLPTPAVPSPRITAMSAAVFQQNVTLIKPTLLIATQGSEKAECWPPVTAWADSEELASNRRTASHSWPSSAYRHCTQRTALTGSAGERGCGKTVAPKRPGAVSRALQLFVSQCWVWHVFTAPTSSCSPQIEPDSLLPGLARDVHSTLAAPTSRTGWSWPVRWRVTS